MKQVRALLQVECPECAKVVSSHGPRQFRRFPIHTDASTLVQCGKSGKPITEADYFNTKLRAVAADVLALSGRLRRQHPSAVWQYLEALDADQLRYMLLVALTAVPGDEVSLSQAYGWVYDLSGRLAS